MTKLLLVSCALSLGQAGNTGPGWQLNPYYSQGLELLYQGEYVEESLIPGVKHQRLYHVESTVFYHKAGKGSAEVALQSSVTMATNAKDRPSKTLPGSVRLELLKANARGGLEGMAPTTRLLSLDGPPLLETGFFFEAPLISVRPDYTWEVMEEGRPARVWKVVGTEAQHGTTCVKLLGRQQSDEWARPRADRSAWHRVDVLWFAPQFGAVVRLERTILRREPARTEPTQRSTVTYNLESKLQYPGQLYTDRSKELLLAVKSIEDADLLLKNPAVHKARIHALNHRITWHLDHQPPTPYRRALLHLQGRLEAARNGVIPAAAETEEVVSGTVAIGKKVPDFVVTDLINKESVRLHSMLGKPVLIFYYNPKANTCREILRFAHTLIKTKGAEVSLLAMAVTDDLELVRQQHENMALPFSILDGKAMQRTLGVDGTPRFLVLDSEGLLRWAATGWGVQTAQEIQAELQRSMEK